LVSKLVFSSCSISWRYATNSITVTIITNAAYGYDNAGNLTTVSYNSGSRTLGLSWNQQYQLTSVSTNGSAAESYTYDAVGSKYCAGPSAL
jgi:hypothetical protein